MSQGTRPNCIGMLGEEDECELCTWREECARMTEQLEADAFRGGTHVRLVSKYSEKKFKPKKIP